MAALPRPLVSRLHGREGWVEFARRPVHPRLARLVVGRCGNQERAANAVARRLPASSLVPVVISFGDPVEVCATAAGEGAGRSYGSFVAGFRPGHTVTRFRGESTSVQVYLTPLGVRQILGVPGHVVANQVLDLDLVAPSLAALAGPLSGLRTWDERLALVDQRLVELADRGLPADPLARALWRRLQETSGAARIGELSRETGFSQRNVTARFRHQVGLRPKAAARVLRFERATRAISGGRALADAAVVAGYADQSHLTREFAQLAGITPAAWVRSPPASPAGALGLAHR